MNYIKKNNTYFATPKDDWKDRIEVVVGDDKQLDFKDQIKIMRWDNEVNCSIRLIDDEPSIISIKDGKIIALKQKKELNFYDVAPTEEYPEGGYEFEVILKEKPKTNKIEFTFQDKGIKYYYQPPLTQEFREEDCDLFTPTEIHLKNGYKYFRPENVVGSYEVYTSENKINYVEASKLLNFSVEKYD